MEMHALKTRTINAVGWGRGRGVDIVVELNSGS